MLALISFNAVAQEECVRATPEALIKEPSELKNYAITKTENKIQESFVLKNGQEVKVIQSGCEHYYLSFRFVTSLYPKHETYKRAVELYDQVRELVPLNSKTIYKALKSVTVIDQVPEYITITEGYDWVSVFNSSNNGVYELVITYDIAL